LSEMRKLKKAFNALVICCSADKRVAVFSAPLLSIWGKGILFFILYKCGHFTTFNNMPSSIKIVAKPFFMATLLFAHPQWQIHK
jgi:hypothetical protein